MIFAVAEQPNFEAFFGGLESAVGAGGILLVGLVVIVSIKKLLSGA